MTVKKARFSLGCSVFVCVKRVSVCMGSILVDVILRMNVTLGMMQVFQKAHKFLENRCRYDRELSESC